MSGDQVVVAQRSEVGGRVGLDHDVGTGGVDGFDGGVEGESSAQDCIVADQGQAG